MRWALAFVAVALVSLAIRRWLVYPPELTHQELLDALRERKVWG